MGFVRKGILRGSDQLLREAKEMGLIVGVRFLNNTMDAQYRYDLKVEVVESIQWIVANGCKPDIAIYQENWKLLLGFWMKQERKVASKLLLQMAEKGCKPDTVTYGIFYPWSCCFRSYE